MSVTQAWLGAVAVKLRSRTLGAMGDACREAVVTRKRRRLRHLARHRLVPEGARPCTASERTPAGVARSCQSAAPCRPHIGGTFMNSVSKAYAVNLKLDTCAHGSKRALR